MRTKMVLDQHTRWLWHLFIDRIARML